MCDQQTVMQDAARLLVHILATDEGVIVAVAHNDEHAAAVQAAIEKMIQTCTEQALHTIVRRNMYYNIEPLAIAGMLLAHYNKQQKTAASKAASAKWN